MLEKSRLMPPFCKTGKTIESKVRKALYDFAMVETDHIAVALSGGKDSLTLLLMLHAIVGRGFPPFNLTALHVSGAFSCGAQLTEGYLETICSHLNIELVTLHQESSNQLECYSCSRKRRSLLFDAATKRGIDTIAFGHNEDDHAETLLMNLLHKAEFCSMLPKITMHTYGVTILRPLLYVGEPEIIAFSKQCGFHRIVCRCPVGAQSMRKKTKELIKELSTLYPMAKENIAKASLIYGSKKAMNPTNKKDL